VESGPNVGMEAHAVEQIFTTATEGPVFREFEFSKR
jgi:hypothetical protein